ncbi:ATP-binding protein [Vallicoccus soli]|uniref:ATP-binding protein n=1 Tax=Vallicoccus soli TaxID=2339232 RepID=A0A3A3ZBI8_9ACTN|nr:ATP-binding protein [Vallicoccus soli]
MGRAGAVTLLGVEGHVVGVEAHLAQGLPAFILVGLPDAALSESRDRVRAAVVNSGIGWPNRRITVSLVPASLPKGGSHFDLPVACAVLAAAGVVPQGALDGAVLLGELGLDGRVRPVRGVLPAVLAAAAGGARRVVVPAGNAREAALVPDVEVVPVRTLGALVGLLRGERAAEPGQGPEEPAPEGAGAGKDLSDVLGQPEGRAALEVCAAGGHHLFLLGPPGAGKTMLAERLPGLLPELDREAALEVSAIHSVAGTLPPGAPLVRRPPFEDPHHSATAAAVVGGGSGMPRPGAISLAHRGVLLLDEAPEFARPVLDALRQPLESGVVVVRRAAGAARYPARFQLVLAANPCPCGLSGGSREQDLRCRCSPHARLRYVGKLSGPLLDRVDLRVRVPPVARGALLEDAAVEGTAVVRERVLAARERALHRLRALDLSAPPRTNAEVPGPVLRRRWAVPEPVVRLLDQHLQRGTLSARGLDRVLRVAWTLADLAGRDVVGPDDVLTAVLWRETSTAGAA